MMCCMRMPRMKAPPGEDALRHCISRIVGGSYIFGAKEKAYFVQHMWRMADFLGIRILDYVIMSNHYHQVVEVPGHAEVTDEELLGRLGRYYGEHSREFKELGRALAEGAGKAELLRRKYFRRFANISEYQKHLKSGFSRWYNKRKDRQGTLWMERFKGPLVEDAPEPRQIVSAYVDLNPVRACIVDDPKDYRHCGYAAALAGDLRCRQGIMRIMGIDDWEAAAAAYRKFFMRRGSRQTDGKPGFISRELLLKTLQENGHLPRNELLLLRIRYLTDGLVFGTELFVERLFLQYRSHFGEKRKSGPRPLRELVNSHLHTLRALRKSAVS